MERFCAYDLGITWDLSTLETRDSTDAIVIHHSAGPAWQNAENIHAAHRDGNGWVGIGYHYCINDAGEIQIGRPRDAIGAHAAGHNSNTIGICVIGNYDMIEPSRDQIESLSMLIAALCYDYSVEINEHTILGHCDLDATACPGKYLYERLPVIIGKAIFYSEQ